MSADQFVIFALQMAAMLACAMAGGWLMRRCGQPAVLGEMLGGILLGPTVFGLLWPAAYEWLFPASSEINLARGAAIKLGMLLFLLVVGLEIHLDQLFKHGVTALLVGTIGTLFPLACGVALVYALPSLWGEQATEHRFSFALFIGASLANSANPVLARILYDLGLLRQKIGAVLMTATVVDDLVGWSLLAVILSDFSTTPDVANDSSKWFSVVLVLVFFVAVLLLGSLMAPRLLRFTRAQLPGSSGFLGVVIVLTMLSAAAAESLGIHAFLGPFLLGVALAPRDAEETKAYEVVQDFVLSFFVPIYFVSMGLSANFVTNFQFSLTLWIVAVAFISKLASVYLAARLGGLDRRTSLAVGFGMNARGAIGIILASLGLEHGVIDKPTFVALVLMCLITSLVAGPAMKWLLPLVKTEISSP